MSIRVLVASAIAAIAASDAASAQTTPVAQPDYSFEKCYGVAKSGQNDCQTATHACAGTAKADAQGDSWIYLPAGTCTKIVGGSLQPE